MVIIPGGIAKQCRQFVAQIRAQGGDVVAAVQNAVVIQLLGHVIRASFNARTTACAVIFISWSDCGAGTEEQCAGDKHCQFAVAHNDFLISDRSESVLR